MESTDEKILNFFEGNFGNKVIFNYNHINEKRIKKAYIIIFTLLMLIIACLSLFFILFPMKKESYTNMKDNEKFIMRIEEETCDKGDNEKCLTCKGNLCGSCNIGYKLKEGKCAFTYSFKATYEATTLKKMVQLFNYDEKKTYKIINVQFNGKNKL